MIIKILVYILLGLIWSLLFSVIDPKRYMHIMESRLYLILKILKWPLSIILLLIIYFNEMGN